MDDNRKAKGQSTNEVKHQLNFEKLISRILSQFVGTFDIDNAINASLEAMGEFIRADRVYVFLVNEDRSTIDNTHEWCGGGIAPQIDDQKKLPVESFPWWAGKLRSGELIHIADVADMPVDAAGEKQVLESQGVKSFLVLPVYVGGEPVGFIGFDATREPRVWQEEDIGLLRTASEIIGNSLARVRLEKELRQSEERYRSVFENTGTATVIIEADMIISLANEEFARLSGYCREEVEGKKRWTEFVAKEDLDRMIGYHRSRRTNGGSVPRNYEFHFIDRGGETKDILLTAAVIPGTGKSVASLVDITGRKEIENALRESEEQYRSLIHLGGEVGEAVVMLQDTDQGEGIQVFVSDRWLHITGYTRKELIGKSFFNLVYPGSRNASLERHRRKMRGEIIPGLFEMLVIRKDGAEVPIELTSAYTTYRGGHADVLYVRDITERKAVEDQLRQSEAKYSVLVEQAQDGICIIQDGLLQFANLRLAEMWGGTVGEIINTPFLGYIHSDNLPLVADRYNRRMKGEKSPDKYEAVLLHKDGSRAYVELSVGVITYLGRSAELAIVRDISERKKAEEELKQERALFVSGPTVVFRWLAAYGWPIEYVSPNVYGLLGYTAEELMDGKHLFRDMLHPDDLPRIA
ncbi:MAG: PAS domain S-box protein, partial [Dehalococcoidales bacterium]|nr:PAS domain S-box protein [Dehalococcoidales bacterium]